MAERIWLFKGLVEGCFDRLAFEDGRSACRLEKYGK